MNRQEQINWINSHKKQIKDMAIKRCLENYEDGKRISKMMADRDEYDPVDEIKKKIHLNKNGAYESMYGHPYKTPEDILYEGLLKANKFDYKSMIHSTYDCKETIGKLNLKPYLKRIRNNDYETLIYLLIKNNKVIREYSYAGNSQRVTAGKNEVRRIIKEARDLKASLYDVHNHPMCIAAIPSCAYDPKTKKPLADIGVRYRNGKLCAKYGVKYLDSCVVTQFDYYSARQKEGKEFYLNTSQNIIHFNKKEKEIHDKRRAK